MIQLIRNKFIRFATQIGLMISLFLTGLLVAWMFSANQVEPYYVVDLKDWLIKKQRQQSRYILQGIKECAIRWIDYFQKVEHKNLTMADINRIVDYCAAGHRSAGPTGDYFTIWDYCPKFGVPCFGGDNSPDCQGYSNTRTIFDELIWQKPAKEAIKKFIQENHIHDKRLELMIQPNYHIWIDDLKYIKQKYPEFYNKVLHPLDKPNKLRIVMHNKPELATKALEKMMTFVDSTPEFNAYWQFDNSKEHLEWKVVRSHDVNVWGKKIQITSTPSNDTATYGRLLVAIGFQEDELFDKDFQKMISNYNTLWKRLKYLMIALIVANIFASFIFLKVMYVLSHAESVCDQISSDKKQLESNQQKGE